MSGAALPEGPPFSKEYDRVPVEMINPPGRHPAVRLGLKPLFVEASKPVNGFRMVPPLRAPMLVLRSIHRLQDHDKAFHPVHEILWGVHELLSPTLTVRFGASHSDPFVCWLLIRSTVSPMRTLTDLSRNHGTVRTMVPPP